MNEDDIFRKIGFGLKFDEVNFQKNSQRFHSLPSKPFLINDIKPSPELNFFKKNSLKSKLVDGNLVKKQTEVAINEENLSHLSEKHQKNEDNLLEDETNTESSSVINHSVNENVAKQGKVASSKYLRKMHKIYVEGSDVPGLITTFEQLHSTYNFNKTCLSNIGERMGFSFLTPIQMQAVPALLHGREILACAPTGSGKTLAFLIPVIHHLLRPTNTADDQASLKKKGFRGLIISPTKELAEQTFHECKTLLLPKNSEDEMKSKKPLLRVKILDKKETKIFSRTGAIHSNKIDLLITTPNRIVYLLEQNPPLISLQSVEWLIVDESDKLFEKGASKLSFRDQLGQIYSACNNPKIRRAMFSATFAYDVQQWCILNMDNVLQVTVGGKNTAVETVEQELKYVGNEQGKLLALKEIILLGFTPPVLVFVQSKERAKELFAELLYEGKKVDAIHSDRAPSQRENAVKCFRRGDTWILICTELMGRGIDFKGVNLVVNYDFPTSAISYIHRIGRTGRAGRKGKAVTFFTDEDRPLLRSIANVVRQAGCDVPDYMLELRKPQKRTLKLMAKTERKRHSIRTAPPEVLKMRGKFHKSKTGSSKKDSHKKQLRSTKTAKKTTTNKKCNSEKKANLTKKASKKKVSLKKNSNFKNKSGSKEKKSKIKTLKKIRSTKNALQN